MKTQSSKSYRWTSAMAGVSMLFGAVTAQAAFVAVPDNTPELPGIALGAGTTGLTGSVIASQEIPWVNLVGGTATGVVRSLVVDTGAGYDFYYQVINTSTGGVNNGNDIFRIAIPGFSMQDPTQPISATYRTDGLAGLTLDALSSSWSGASLISNNAGGGQVFSVDREPALDTPDFLGGGVGFDFDASQFINLNVPGGPTTAPDNIEAGEWSNWLVVRTNLSQFETVMSSVLSNGSGTGLASTFAPIPEPSTVLFGLAMFGVCAGGRLRKPRVQ